MFSPGTHRLTLPDILNGLFVGTLLLLPLTASAQLPVTASPALVVDGGSVTVSTPTVEGDNVTLDLGGAPAGTSMTQQTANGIVSLTVTPLPAGAYVVYVYVTNMGAGSVQSQVNKYTLQVFAKNAIDSGALQGQYAFQLSGQASNVKSGPQAVGGVGSFTADGNGNITAGILDLNTPTGVEAGLPVTGTYQVNAYGNGTVNLVTSSGTLQLQVQGLPLFSSTLVLIDNGQLQVNPVPTYLTGGVFSTNAAGLVSATGTLIQTRLPLPPNFFRVYKIPPFLPMLNGTYAASLTGEQGGSGMALGGALQVAFTNAGTVMSTGTIAGNGTSFSYAGLTGSYPQFDVTTGRTTSTLTDPTQPYAAAQMYSVYQLPQGGFYFLSISPRSQVGLLVGTAGAF